MIDTLVHIRDNSNLVYHAVKNQLSPSWKHEPHFAIRSLDNKDSDKDNSKDDNAPPNLST